MDAPIGGYQSSSRGPALQSYPAIAPALPTTPAMHMPLTSEHSLVRAQQGLSDEDAFRLAVMRDEDELEQAVLGAEVQVVATTHATVSSSNSDAALAAALADMEAKGELIGEDHAVAEADLEVLPAGPRDVLLSDRLARLPSIQLRPSVNPPQGGEPPASLSADRDRLLLRLEHFGLVERVVKGDGACQFRSLSDQLYGTPEHHDAVRCRVVNQLELRPERYMEYIPDVFAVYCESMRQPSTWGDHVTLQAAADAFGLRVVVVTSFKEGSVLAIEPEDKMSQRVLWLSFWAEVHYNSIYPAEEPPAPAPVKPPKILGSRKLGRLLANNHHPGQGN